MKGPVLALCTVTTWAIMSVVNRYCLLKFDINVLVFTSFLIFSGGAALLILREPISPDNWKSGVKYSWLYTIMQIIKSFFMISTYLYISSSETSLLINIEVVITYILAYLFFRRVPHKRDFWGIFFILSGFILFIYSLPKDIRTATTILLLIAATASCVRSIVVEQTTQKSPDTSVRQKCGISGYTMFIGGLMLILFFFLTATVKLLINSELPPMLSILNYLPDMPDMLNPETIISGSISGFFLNASSVYFFYATLKWARSETFMAFRVLQPALTYSFELLIALTYSAMKPVLTTKDFILGGVILLGSFLILIAPLKERKLRSKDFITE